MERAISNACCMFVPHSKSQVASGSRSGFTSRATRPKLTMPKGMIDAYAHPPSSPDECVFARTTMTLSADLNTKITPCQYGGAPDCTQCGCIASAGLAAVARHQLFGFIPVGAIFNGSLKIGERMRRLRPVEPTPA